jgi:hypothetical protein
MATYQNVGLINSPNINNNNNNNHHHLSPTLNRDSYDYSPTKSHKKSNSKSSGMPKHHYQNTTTNKRDFVPAENGSDYLTPVDMDSTTNSNEPTKRVNNTNGKFSIQKMIRQGFSSWRTRRKPPPLSTPPPPSFISTNTSTPPPPSSATERSIITDNDLSQVHPSTTMRSISNDPSSYQTSPQRIIVTEQIAPASVRTNNADGVSVDFDRPPTNTRGYIQSPWATSSTTKPDSVLRPVPLPTNRILPVQFNENAKPSVTIPLTAEIPNTISSSNPPKIPPPGMYSFILIYYLDLFF